MRVSDIKRDCARELDVGSVTGVLGGGCTVEGEGIRDSGRSMNGRWRKPIEEPPLGFEQPRRGREAWNNRRRRSPVARGSSNRVCISFRAAQRGTASRPRAGVARRRPASRAWKWRRRVTRLTVGKHWCSLKIGRGLWTRSVLVCGIRGLLARPFTKSARRSISCARTCRPSETACPLRPLWCDNSGATLPRGFDARFLRGRCARGM